MVCGPSEEEVNRSALARTLLPGSSGFKKAGRETRTRLRRNSKFAPALRFQFRHILHLSFRISQPPACYITPNESAIPGYHYLLDITSTRLYKLLLTGDDPKHSYS